MNRLLFGIGDFIFTLKSFNPDQPRDENGKWTGGSGGRDFESEGSGRTGKYAGQYSGGSSQLNSSARAVHDAILDNQNDIQLHSPIVRQTKFMVHNKTTNKTAHIEIGIKKIHVNLYRPKAEGEGLGAKLYKSKVFQMSDWADPIATNEASNFVKSELNQ